MINIQIFTFNALQENTYVLWDETKECVIIDPGCYDKEEKEELKSFIAENALKVVELLNTHGHVDHVLGNHFVKELYKVKLAHHELDEQTLLSVKVYAPTYGFIKYEESQADKLIDEGDRIKFGNSYLDILFVPGHAPGHVAFYNKEERICIGGDVLFYGSVGRTDLPGGNFDVLMDSIKNKMFKLPDDMMVYPGHGPRTTIGREKKTNPFCAIN